MKRPLVQSNKLIIGIVLIVIISSLNGCACDITITDKKLSSSMKFEYGFQISRITVLEFSETGVPIEYVEDTIIHCSPYCTEFANEHEYKIIYGEDAEFVDTCKFKASGTVYFNKANENYDWWYFKPYQPKKEYKIFPNKFIPGTWYVLRNICTPYDYYFIYVKSNGRFEVKHVEIY